MPDILRERVCADVNESVVVFLIGVRLNKLWKVWKWWPVFSAMPRMLRELAEKPGLGLLHARSHVGLRSAMIVQYWQSAEHLHAYATAENAAHLPAWQAFNRAVGLSGDVGIWHETYIVGPGTAETIYANMPRYGLGLARGVVPAHGKRATAKERLDVI